MKSFLSRIIISTFLLFQPICFAMECALAPRVIPKKMQVSQLSFASIKDMPGVMPVLRVGKPYWEQLIEQTRDILSQVHAKSHNHCKHSDPTLCKYKKLQRMGSEVLKAELARLRKKNAPADKNYIKKRIKIIKKLLKDPYTHKVDAYLKVWHELKNGTHHSAAEALNKYCNEVGRNHSVK